MNRVQNFINESKNKHENQVIYTCLFEQIGSFVIKPIDPEPSIREFKAYEKEIPVSLILHVNWTGLVAHINYKEHLLEFLLEKEDDSPYFTLIPVDHDLLEKLCVDHGFLLCGQVYNIPEDQ